MLAGMLPHLALKQRQRGHKHLASPDYNFKFPISKWPPLSTSLSLPLPLPSPTFAQDGQHDVCLAASCQLLCDLDAIAKLPCKLWQYNKRGRARQTEWQRERERGSARNGQSQLNGAFAAAFSCRSWRNKIQQFVDYLVRNNCAKLNRKLRKKEREREEIKPNTFKGSRRTVEFVEAHKSDFYLALGLGFCLAFALIAGT